jgi:hypothetical protein
VWPAEAFGVAQPVVVMDNLPAHKFPA